MSVPDKISLLTARLVKLPQQKIAQICSVVLLIYVAYLCAQFTWLWVPKTNGQYGGIKNNSQLSINHNDSYNLAKIQALNLFGQFQQVNTVTTIAVKDAPETRLNLVLTGVVASTQTNIGAAIIANAGKQETYGIGDVITGTRASLAQVMHDRVLIKQAGQLETLMLDGFKYQKVAPVNKYSPSGKPINNGSARSRTAKHQLDQRNNQRLKIRMARLKQDFVNNPSKITDYLKIAPQHKAGRLIGYRLMPGKDKEFFQSSGLKYGDIAIQMNGFDLTIPRQAVQALKALREDSEITLTIDRHGEIITILFGLNAQHQNNNY